MEKLSTGRKTGLSVVIGRKKKSQSFRSTEEARWALEFSSIMEADVHLRLKTLSVKVVLRLRFRRYNWCIEFTAAATRSRSL